MTAEAVLSRPLSLLVAAVVGVPFLIAWCVGVGSWFLALVEIGVIHRLSDVLFDRGPIVLRREIDLAPPAAPAIGQRTQLDGSQLRFTSPTRAIFGPRLRWFAFGSVGRPSPVKGVISWSGSGAEVVVRQSLGLVTFLRSWLVGWTIVSVAATVAAFLAPDRGGILLALPMMVIGGLAGYGMYRFMLWHGRRSAALIADEVVSSLRS